MDMTVYGFVVDTALFGTADVDLTNSTDQGLGYLNDNLVNYLREVGKIKDARTARLDIWGNNSLSGKMLLLFDKDRVGDTAPLTDMTKTFLLRLFNVIERVVYHNSLSEEALETVLTGDSNFKGYVPNSLLVGTAGTDIVISPGGTTQPTTIKDWVSFSFQTTSAQIHFHLWINSKAFAADYPYTTITKVIPPHRPALLVTPNALLRESSLPILISSATFSFAALDKEIARTDHNGIYTYATKYVVGEQSSVSLPFALTYCGAKVPSTIDCRKAIREYLQSTELVPDAQLEILFPELFVGSQFFIVPLWGHFVIRPTTNLYPSITPQTLMNSVAKTFFPEYDSVFLSEHIEYLTNAYSTLGAIAVPDKSNEKHFSILEQHPSYRSYSSHDPAFGIMDSVTQEFSRKLALCFSVLHGEETSAEIIQTPFGENQFLTFMAKYSEYHVLTKKSYFTYIEKHGVMP